MKRILLLLCGVFLLAALAGCGAPVNTEDVTARTLSVDVDADAVTQIDLYWNYRTCSVRRGESDSLIDETIGRLNGTYTACGTWVNQGTGSGNRIDLYDADGNALETYYVFTDADGALSLWDARSPEHIRYRNEDRPDALAKLVADLRDAAPENKERIDMARMLPETIREVRLAGFGNEVTLSEAQRREFLSIVGKLTLIPATAYVDLQTPGAVLYDVILNGTERITLPICEYDGRLYRLEAPQLLAPLEDFLAE